MVDETGERRADVVVADGSITAVGTGIDAPAGATVLDAGGCLVARDWSTSTPTSASPGGRKPRRWRRRPAAAARGGYTAVVGMPNTTPPIDSAAVALEVLGLGARALCQVAVAGAITVGRAGERLAPHGRAGRPGGDACSPTTAPGSRTPASCVGPSSTPGASV